MTLRQFAHSVWVKNAITASLICIVGSCTLQANPQQATGATPVPNGSQLRGELVGYDASSKTFSPYLSGISAGDLEVSPDGKSVAYVSYPDQILWRSKLDGSDKLALTRKPMNAALPHWSPDSQQIAYMASSATDQPWTVYFVGSGGGDPQQLLPKASDEGDPCWISNEEVIYGASGFGEIGPSASLHKVNVKTRQVSDIAESGGLYSARCSPDGRHIVALPTSAPGVRLLELSSGKWSILTDKQAGYPAWSRDSKSVYFQSVAGRIAAIWRVRVADGQSNQVVTLGTVTSVPGRMGTWSGLAADDSPITLRQYATKEQAELMEVERRIAEAYSHSDSGALSHLISEDLVDTGITGGVSNKDQDISAIRTAPFQTSVEKMQALAYADSGVVMGIGHARFSFAGNEYKQSWRFTDTFHRERDGWQLVATQQTRLPEPYVRDVQDAELKPLNADTCAGESAIRATSFEVPSFIRFINRGSQPVKLYWMNYQGHRDQERTLLPGEPADIDTYAGHSFVVVDENGKCASVYRSGVDSGLATVGPNLSTVVSEAK